VTAPEQSSPDTPPDEAARPEWAEPPAAEQDGVAVAAEPEHDRAREDEPLADGDELIPVSDEQERVGTTVGERYRITALIGMGGMGAVYRAEHIHMKKQVALKVLHREMTVLPEVVARFEREAIAAARIEHPNVVQARDFGRLEDGAYYLVLEHVDGETLSHVLEHEEFTIGRSLQVALQVAQALGAAHEQHIVHRDLKPDNVMMVRGPSAFERIKVLDFGIAKVSIHERGQSQRPLTRMGSVFGTPEYMAPEQAAGQRVDHRADLYALGLLLYRMIAGHAPFTAKHINQVLMMQITQPVPELPDTVPGEVTDVIHKLLEKTPDDRFQSADEVVTSLLQLLEGVPGETLNLSVAPPLEKRGPAGAGDNGLASQFGTRLDQSPLGFGVPVAGNLIPMWRLGMVTVVLIALASTLVWLLHNPESGGPLLTGKPSATAAATTATTPRPEIDPELEKLLGLAFSGDEAALSELEKRPRAERSVREWLALGRGRAKLGRTHDALEAYQVALERDPAAGSDPALQRDVAEALKDDATAPLALELAAKHLGSSGADMLYHAWVETKDVTPTTQTARKLLQTETVRSHASPALEFLLTLREAMSCDDYRRLLPRAAVTADSRAVTLLARLLNKNDCDLSEEALHAAIAACKDRPGPGPF
jgi:serine/threonine-protein kinase